MRRASAIVIGAIVAGAVAVGGVAVPLTNHPKFCASCHTIKPSYESWLQSSHKEVECVACHVRPGIVGWLHDKAWNGTKDVAIYPVRARRRTPHNLRATGRFSGLPGLPSQHFARVRNRGARSAPAGKRRGLDHEPSQAHGGVRRSEDKAKGARPAMRRSSMSSRSRDIRS